MIRILAIAAVTSVVLTTAVAQPPDAAAATRASLYDPPLERLVADALANAPETIVAQSALEAARRRVVPAKTLADPFLSTTHPRA